jgi:L-Ala-D/L-Glu epimerase
LNIRIFHPPFGKSGENTLQSMNQKLTIRHTELYKLSIPLIEPFTTSLGQDDAAENVLVKIVTEEGITGFGECSPYMPINGESQDTCFIVCKGIKR